MEFGVVPVLDIVDFEEEKTKKKNSWFCHG